MSIGEAVADQERREYPRFQAPNGVLVSEILGPEDGPYPVPPHFWNPEIWRPAR